MGEATDGIERGLGQLINVWVEDLVDEANGWRFIGVLIWELDVDFPLSAGERCCNGGQRSVRSGGMTGCSLSEGPLKLT